MSLELGSRSLLTLFIAIILDILDYFGAFVPIVGDFVDLFGSGILYLISEDPVMLLGMTELVPFMDFLPTNIALALWHIYRRQGMD